VTLAELTALLEAEQARAKEQIDKVETAADLEEFERTFLGKRSAATTANQGIKGLAPDERPRAGQAVSAYKAAINELVEDRRAALGDGAGAIVDRLDLTLPGRGLGRGHLHLITQVQQELEEVFLGLGYEVAEGPEVETDFYNFEALNMPPAHPARSGFDTLYLRMGAPESTLLRTHTSPVQIRVMQTQRPPIYAVMPGRVYRKDTPDARHTPAFQQIEGLVVDRGITFGDLAGTIETFTTAYFGPDIHSRLRPAYFPFTEPSAEYEITCVICRGAGCRTCSGTGWIELGGCGMVHPNVLRAGGVDPEEWSGFAFGFGIDRLAQMRHSIADMRILLDNDIRFVSQF
jgi:phenylalanyl-tRNA synthetase alpha chain